MVLLPIVYGPEESHGGDIVAFITVAVLLGGKGMDSAAQLTTAVVGFGWSRWSALEDRTLQDELAGYKDYAQGVRYRLPPGIC